MDCIILFIIIFIAARTSVLALQSESRLTVWPHDNNATWSKIIDSNANTVEIDLQQLGGAQLVLEVFLQVLNLCIFFL